MLLGLLIKKSLGLPEEAVGDSSGHFFISLFADNLFLSLWFFCVLGVKGLEGAAPWK